MSMEISVAVPVWNSKQLWIWSFISTRSWRRLWVLVLLFIRRDSILKVDLLRWLNKAACGKRYSQWFSLFSHCSHTSWKLSFWVGDPHGEFSGSSGSMSAEWRTYLPLRMERDERCDSNSGKGCSSVGLVRLPYQCLTPNIRHTAPSTQGWEEQAGPSQSQQALCLWSTDSSFWVESLLPNKRPCYDLFYKSNSLKDTVPWISCQKKKDNPVSTEKNRINEFAYMKFEIYVPMCSLCGGD